MTLQLTQGDTTAWAVPVYREDTDEWITDLTGSEAVYMVTTDDGGGDTVLEKTSQDSQIEFEQASSIESHELDDEGVPDDAVVVVIELTSSDTGELDVRRYYHELEIQFADQLGSEKTVVGPSPIQVNPSAT